MIKHQFQLKKEWIAVNMAGIHKNKEPIFVYMNILIKKESNIKLLEFQYKLQQVLKKRKQPYMIIFTKRILKIQISRI